MLGQYLSSGVAVLYLCGTYLHSRLLCAGLLCVIAWLRSPRDDSERFAAREALLSYYQDSLKVRPEALLVGLCASMRVASGVLVLYGSHLTSK
jgi:hypothetical protein